MAIGIVDEPIIGQNQDWLEIKKHIERNIDENNLKYYYLRRDGKVYI